ELARIVGGCGRLVQPGEDRAVVVCTRNGAQLVGAALESRVAVGLRDVAGRGCVSESTLAVAGEHTGAAELEQERAALTVMHLEHLAHCAVVPLAERRDVAALRGRNGRTRQRCCPLGRADRGL